MNKNNDELKELEQKYLLAGEYGHNLQKEGIKIRRVADKGLETIGWLKSDEKAWQDPSAEAWIIGANATIPAYSPKNLNEISSYGLTIGITTSTASTLFLSPSYLQNKKDYDLNEDELAELDGYLAEFSHEFRGIGDLAVLRKGAWESFYSATEVNLMTASHSMREILSKIISKLASNKTIENNKVNGFKEKATLKDRIEFLISDSSKKVDASKKMIDMATKKCFEAYTRLQEVAHGSSELKQEVEACMKITEHALLSILRFRKLRFKKKA